MAGSRRYDLLELETACTVVMCTEGHPPQGWPALYSGPQLRCETAVIVLTIPCSAA